MPSQEPSVREPVRPPYRLSISISVRRAGVVRHVGPFCFLHVGICDCVPAVGTVVPTPEENSVPTDFGINVPTVWWFW